MNLFGSEKRKGDEYLCIECKKHLWKVRVVWEGAFTSGHCINKNCSKRGIMMAICIFKEEGKDYRESGAGLGFEEDSDYKESGKNYKEPVMGL